MPAALLGFKMGIKEEEHKVVNVEKLLPFCDFRKHHHNRNIQAAR